jgi:hypothetical protein
MAGFFIIHVVDQGAVARQDEDKNLEPA